MMAPEGAVVPAVSTGPPSETRAALIDERAAWAIRAAAPRRSIAGEIATPPDAVIESERPFVQLLPAVPRRNTSGAARRGR